MEVFLGKLTSFLTPSSFSPEASHSAPPPPSPHTPRAIVSRVSPAYPELARRMHVSGKVVLLVTIQPDGKVSATKVESGHALLAPAAQDAVSRWRFAPGPEASESEIDVNFADGQ